MHNEVSFQKYNFTYAVYQVSRGTEVGGEEQHFKAKALEELKQQLEREEIAALQDARLLDVVQEGALFSELD